MKLISVRGITKNHADSIATHTMRYNFIRISQTLRCTPAMEPSVTGQLWYLVDMAKVLEPWEVCKDAQTYVEYVAFGVMERSRQCLPT